MISPPYFPALGPMSITWSARSIMSLSCSTTITEFPVSRRATRELISFSLSRWCNPILGSSRMYKTPTSCEPIWVASLIRCASPPDSDFALLFMDK